VIEQYLLDTSAILAAWQGEEGSNDVKELLDKAVRGECKLYISFMTFFEAYYVVKREVSDSKAFEIYRWLSSLPAERVNLEETILTKAGDLKVEYNKYNISALDAWIIATALVKNAHLIHRDKGFDAINATGNLPIRLIKIPIAPPIKIWMNL